MHGGRAMAVVMAVTLAASGCASMRWYSMPLSPMEGQAFVPALITTAERHGLRGYRGIDGAVVDLEDGTTLSWQDSADHRDFILVVHLDGDGPKEGYDARFAQARARADQLWDEAVATRRQLAPPTAVMVVPAAAPPPSGFSMSVSGPSGGTMRFNAPTDPAPAGAGSCQLGSDGVKACGYDCRVGSDGRAACASTPDGSCHLNSNGSFSCGRNCQLTSSGLYACQ